MVTIRYQLHTTSFRRYLPITVASDVSDDTVALIMEHQSELQGVDVVEDYKRVYNDSVYFASLLGYTGKASTEELEQLRKQSDNYSSSSIIGKTGIEQSTEILAGAEVSTFLVHSERIPDGRTEDFIVIDIVHADWYAEH